MSRAESERPLRDRAASQVEIERLRARIDAVDDAILAQLNERAELVGQVGREKQAEGSAVYEPTRERRIIERLRAGNPGPFPSAGIAPVFREIISATRSLEEAIRVAYLGPEGTFLLFEGDGIVSAASWEKTGDERVGRVAFVATAPSHRRHGHAATLLGRCEEQARRAGRERLRTGPFVDSRYEPACRLFEHCGFQVHALEQSDMTMETDIEQWEPREPALPDGYQLVRFHDGDEQAWCDLKAAVFGGSSTVEWFRQRFRDQPNFDPDGWFFVEHDGRKVGMAGAIVWFEDAAMARPSGALIEWVGLLPEERGKRLGKALVVACLNYLKERAVRPNCLVTQYFRRGAVGLYEKFGYRVVRECRRYEKAL